MVGAQSTKERAQIRIALSGSGTIVRHSDFVPLLGTSAGRHETGLSDDLRDVVAGELKQLQVGFRAGK